MAKPLSKRDVKKPDNQGGARAGAGRPKGSITKIDTKARRKVADEFAKHALSAMDYFIDLMNDQVEDGEGNRQPATIQQRSYAADKILERGIGKAVSTIELTGADGKDLLPEQTKRAVSNIDPQQLLAMKELLLSLAKPTQPGDEAIVIDQSDD